MRAADLTFLPRIGRMERLRYRVARSGWVVGGSVEGAILLCDGCVSRKNWERSAFSSNLFRVGLLFILLSSFLSGARRLLFGRHEFEVLCMVFDRSLCVLSFRSKSSQVSDAGLLLETRSLFLEAFRNGHPPGGNLYTCG